MTNSLFRTCPDTGLQFHRPAENLMKAYAVAAVVFLLVGGIYGLMVGLTRWQAVHLLAADEFYLAGYVLDQTQQTSDHNESLRMQDRVRPVFDRQPKQAGYHRDSR